MCQHLPKQYTHTHLLPLCIMCHITVVFIFRDTNKTVKCQTEASAKAEERLLNMDFVTAKAKELGIRRERAEVSCDMCP